MQEELLKVVTAKSMSVVLTFEQQCKIHDEKVVYGYTRNNVPSYIDIPVDIINICIQYYYIFRDQFDSDNLGIAHDLTGNTIKHREEEHEKWSTTVLKNVISNGKYCWKFKIIETGAILIGICKTKYSNSVKDKVFAEHDRGYGCMVTHSFKYPGYALIDITAKANHVVSMCLDLTTSTLSYSLNDQDEIIAFQNIDKTEYKAAVYSFWKNCCVQLLECVRLQ